MSICLTQKDGMWLLCTPPICVAIISTYNPDWSFITECNIFFLQYTVECQGILVTFCASVSKSELCLAYFMGPLNDQWIQRQFVELMADCIFKCWLKWKNSASEISTCIPINWLFMTLEFSPVKSLKQILVKFTLYYGFVA